MTNCPLLRFQQTSSTLLRIAELPDLLISDSNVAATDLIDRITMAIFEGTLTPRTEVGFPVTVADCIEKTKTIRCDSRIFSYLEIMPEAFRGLFSTPYQHLRQHRSEEHLRREFAKGLVREEHVAKVDLENWLRTLGLECEFVEPVDQSLKQKVETTAKPHKKARMKSIEQEDLILDVLRAMGHDPESLPPNAPGKSGEKNECKTRLGNDPLFQARTSFSKAWDRLRADGRIKNRKS